MNKRKSTVSKKTNTTWAEDSTSEKTSTNWVAGNPIIYVLILVFALSPFLHFFFEKGEIPIFGFSGIRAFLGMYIPYFIVFISACVIRYTLKFISNKQTKRTLKFFTYILFYTSLFYTFWAFIPRNDLPKTFYYVSIALMPFASFHCFRLLSKYFLTRQTKAYKQLSLTLSHILDTQQNTLKVINEKSFSLSENKEEIQAILENYDKELKLIGENTDIVEEKLIQEIKTINKNNQTVEIQIEKIRKLYAILGKTPNSTN